MLKQLSPGVYCWSQIHGAARNQPYLWNSHVIDAGSHGVLALVDPLPLTTGDAREIEAIGTPTHILITCNYHIRAADALRTRWGCELLLHEAGLEDAEIAVDRALSDGILLWDLVEVIHVPYLTHYPEEVALLVGGEADTLIVGDLVCGGRQDRGIADGQLWISGPQYVMDLQEARTALAELASRRFHVLCCGHGSPITHAAREVLNQFVHSDPAWEKLAAERAEGADAASREFVKSAERKRARLVHQRQDW
jgi:glyoxylase-like metal-dependent hydrolase (beta-lactamase superfamily II)